MRVCDKCRVEASSDVSVLAFELKPAFGNDRLGIETSHELCPSCVEKLAEVINLWARDEKSPAATAENLMPNPDIPFIRLFNNLAVDTRDVRAIVAGPDGKVLFKDGTVLKTDSESRALLLKHLVER